MRVTLIYPAVGRKENTPYVRAWQMQPLSMALLGSLMPREGPLARLLGRLVWLGESRPYGPRSHTAG